MAGSRKKVIVRLERPDQSQGLIPGYLPSAGLLGIGGDLVQLLDTSGRIMEIPLDTIRHIAYVRDFNLDDPLQPERLLRKTFPARPRAEGLWLRLTFKDGEVLEGLARIDESFLDEAIADRGVFLIPPDVRSNTQRLYVPRNALRSMQMAAIVTTPLKAQKKVDQPEAAGLLFPVS